MFNVNEPPGYEPPSAAMLLRSTLAALGLAAVILVLIVLPAEYRVDPTGAGTALGLTRMGEIKTQLAEEAGMEEAEEAVVVMAAEPVTAESAEEATGAPAPIDALAWRDETEVTIAPDEAAELKLLMKAGEEAAYEWTADGGALNFDTHGHGGGQAVTYGKGRATANDEGTLKAPFDGYHGWFWRNRSGNPVSLTLRTRGQYSELVRTR
jgi:hypothetical protein